MDMENVKCSLESILATFGLVLEDMEEEHTASNGVAEAFYTRVEDMYLPALDLLYGATVDLFRQVEAQVNG